MAVTCDPNTLAVAAKCFNGYSPLVLRAIRLRLLCAMLNGESMTCDPNTLAVAAKCFIPVDAGTLEAVETYLLCQVAAGGGGGVSSGHGVPTSTPASSAALYYDLDTGILYQWTGAAWV